MGFALLILVVAGGCYCAITIGGPWGRRKRLKEMAAREGLAYLGSAFPYDRVPIPKIATLIPLPTFCHAMYGPRRDYEVFYCDFRRIVRIGFQRKYISVVGVRAQIQDQRFPYSHLRVLNQDGWIFAIPGELENLAPMEQDDIVGLWETIISRAMQESGRDGRSDVLRPRHEVEQGITRNG